MHYIIKYCLIPYMFRHQLNTLKMVQLEPKHVGDIKNTW
jgi:hypothetical protein